MLESLLRNLLRPNRCTTAGAALILLATGCDLATEPLSASNVVGEYELVLANGFLVPHDPFLSGALTIQADSSYKLFLNDAFSQSGYWTAKGSSFTATATSGDCAPFFAITPKKPMPEWCVWQGYIDSEAIRLLPDSIHSNWYLFHPKD